MSTLYVHVEGTFSHSDDEGVEGVYEVLVNTDLSEGDQVSAALDCFHEHTGIHVLDDFVINVRDRKGNVLAESDSAAYQLGDRAEFMGKV